MILTKFDEEIHCDAQNFFYFGLVFTFGDMSSILIAFVIRNTCERYWCHLIEI